MSSLVFVPMAILYVHGAATSNWGWSVFVLAPLGWALGLVTIGIALAARRDRVACVLLGASAVAYFVGAWLGASGASGC